MTTVARPVRSPGFVLAVLCVCVLVINMDAMIVNVALPSLVEQLHSSTRELQWVADAYNLTFAALVLAAGSSSDRFGRREALLCGLALFTIASALGAYSTTTTELVLARAVMGIGSAFIYPATLSILTNVFVERKQRAAAIGIWGAVSGIGIVLGPVLGGILLQHYWWGSIFIVMAPIGLVSLVLTAAIVPTSRDPQTPPLDRGGLALSCLSVGALVYTLIEAPRHGWASGHTVIGFVVSAALFGALLACEVKADSPMLDIGLFRNARFSAACGAMTVAFFTLYGFTFLATQYLQFLKLYTPMQTGFRLIPVAIGMVLGSVLGGRFAVTWGTRVVVASGLGLLTSVYLWFAFETAGTGYPILAAQLTLIGLGLGTVAIPATEAIMGVVPAPKVSVGSALNDATRLLGGTLGIAVIGSLFQSQYTHHLNPATVPDAPPATLTTAQDSIGNALTQSQSLAASGHSALAAQLADAARSSFFHGFHTACLVIAGISVLMVVAAALWLPTEAPVAEQSDEPAQQIMG